jgi:hypothetical protein
MPVGEKLQDFFRVITDGSKFDPLFLEARGCILQLDQLPFTERSPVCGTEEEQNRAALAFQSLESLDPAELIA